MTEINDLQIIKKCQKGDLDEFSQLYDKYIRKIYDFIYYKTHHKEIAEDLTSKTFIKALEKVKDFKTEQGYFSAWLYTIARNTVIDHYRTKKEDADISDIWDLSSNDNVERDIDTKQKLEKVQKYLSKLKLEQREVIIMRAWQGLSYKEIAEIMGKSQASCKMTFSRTITKLRQDMPIAIFISLFLI